MLTAIGRISFVFINARTTAAMGREFRIKVFFRRHAFSFSFAYGFGFAWPHQKDCTAKLF